MSENELRRRMRQSSVERSVSVTSEVANSVNNSIVDDVFYPSVETAGRLTEEETMEVGSIPCSIYKAYIQSAGYILSAFVLSMFVVNVVGTGRKLEIIKPKPNKFSYCRWIEFVGMSSWWLAHWLNVGVVVS